MSYIFINALDDDTPSPNSSPILFKNTVINPPCNLYQIENYFTSSKKKSFEIYAKKPLTHKYLLPIIPYYIPIEKLNPIHLKKILFPSSALKDIDEINRFLVFLTNYPEIKMFNIKKIIATSEIYDLLKYKNLFPNNSFLILDVEHNYKKKILEINLNFKNIFSYNYSDELSKLEINADIMHKDIIVIEKEFSEREIDLIYLS